MKTSLRLMIWSLRVRYSLEGEGRTHVLVLNVLQELELAICPLGEDWGAEGFHNLLDSHGRACELVLGRATPYMSAMAPSRLPCIDIPDKAEGT
jgi:hypothetical protein